MKILAFALLACGAFLCYGANMLTKRFIKKDDTDKKYSGILKLSGFVLALIGALIVFKLG